LCQIAPARRVEHNVAEAQGRSSSRDTPAVVAASHDRPGLSSRPNQNVQPWSRMNPTRST
jgi:hypothetical protein